jgi:septal ring factor EnvC (AmiA/AmiB activator)
MTYGEVWAKISEVQQEIAQLELAQALEEQKLESARQELRDLGYEATSEDVQAQLPTIEDQIKQCEQRASELTSYIESLESEALKLVL